MVFLSFFNANNYSNIFEIINDHNLAKLGDVFANLIFSIAISESIKSITSKKVSGTILGNAFRRSDFSKYVHLRSDLHTLADYSESIICYSILSEIVSIEACVNILNLELTDINIQNRNMFNIKAINAFQKLLNYIFNIFKENRLFESVP